MPQLFTASDYAKLHSIVFQPDYPGYKPDVVESPNGDGKKDDFKRYAHVAEKYLRDYRLTRQGESAILERYLDAAHELALEVAITIGVPRPFWPVKEYSALRVLEYDGNAVTHPHTDFDLFTLMLYRNDDQYFKYLEEKPTIENFQITLDPEKALQKAQKLNAQVHFGEVLQEIDPESFRANKHEVVATGGPWQYSCVYFAIPNHDAILPSGLTVGQWLEERMKRSRYDRS